MLHGAEERWGSLRALAVWKHQGGLPPVPICRALKLGRAVGASERALPAEGAAQSLSAAPSGFSPPAKSFVWKGTVSSAAFASSFPQPLPPPLTALSSFRFSLLLGWVITGSSCQARGEEWLPRFCVCGPSQPQTGRFPPASGPGPLPSGVT